MTDRLSLDRFQELAAAYGGGGHARAAGFTAPKGWEGDDAAFQRGLVV